MVKVIKYDSLSQPEKAVAIFLEGLLNRFDLDILCDTKEYLSYVEDDYKYVTIDELIDEYNNLIDGIIIYDLQAGDVAINLAANLTILGNYLGIPRCLVFHFKHYNFKVIYDTKDITGSNACKQNYVFEIVKDKVNKDFLVHQVVRKDNFHLFLRDVSIKEKALCIYTGENEEDISFRHKVLEYLNKNIPIYGWNDDELAFINDISKYGDYVIPSDWSSNHSYFNKFNISIKQPCKMQKIIADPAKHYIAIVVSDGDNVQWMETNFLTTSTMAERIESNENYKLNFTFPPLLTTECALCAKKIYSIKKNNYFITGVSGVGYMNPSSFPDKHFSKFISKTIEAMKKSDLHEVCILDNLSRISFEGLKEKLLPYANDEQINGVVMELDPDRYESGKGLGFFIKGKPCLSVKYSLWTTPPATKEFIDSYINKINNEKANLCSLNGYSIINFHPWSMKIKDLDYLVSKLDNHIEIVYINELFELIKNNVKEC